MCKIVKPSLKTVFTVHNTNSFANTNKLNRILQKLFIDMNIAISQAVANECIKNGINKVIKIYNGIFLSLFIPTKKEYKNPTLNIINVARLTHKIKGQDVLIKALKICKDKEMKFICNFVGGKYAYAQDSYDY